MQEKAFKQVTITLSVMYRSHILTHHSSSLFKVSARHPASSHSRPMGKLRWRCNIKNVFPSIPRLVHNVGLTSHSTVSGNFPGNMSGMTRFRIEA
ncbi:hypothetical protein EAE99_010869 [Botrytis elliptica]|nr:hypothetical protein EAE99_010869 [Botrytis elliptica]